MPKGRLTKSPLSWSPLKIFGAQKKPTNYDLLNTTPNGGKISPTDVPLETLDANGRQSALNTRDAQTPPEQNSSVNVKRISRSEKPPESGQATNKPPNEQETTQQPTASATPPKEAVEDEQISEIPNADLTPAKTPPTRASRVNVTKIPRQSNAASAESSVPRTASTTVVHVEGSGKKLPSLTDALGKTALSRFRPKSTDGRISVIKLPRVPTAKR